MLCTVAPECDVYVSFRDVHIKSASVCYYLFDIRISTGGQLSTTETFDIVGAWHDGIRLAQVLSAFFDPLSKHGSYRLEERYPHRCSQEAHTARRLGGQCYLISSFYCINSIYPACLCDFQFFFCFIYVPLYTSLFHLARFLSFWTA